MTLELMTFTGIDQWTDITPILRLAERFPKVEFGILVGSKTQSEICTHSRFPSLRTIQRWKYIAKHYDLKLSLHLCGKYATTVNNGLFGHDVLDLCDGFHRVQVNAVKYNLQNVRAFAHLVNVKHVIMQHRSSFKNLPLEAEEGFPLKLDRIEFLYDTSGGRGQDSIDKWPDPTFYRRCGYAGGINLLNADRVMSHLEHHPDSIMWIDIESGVRTSDRFDVGKIERLCSKFF